MSSGSASGLSAPPPRPDRPPEYRRICRGPSKAHAMWVCDCGGRAMFLSSVISRHSGARTPDVPDHRAAARTGPISSPVGRIIVVAGSWVRAERAVDRSNRPPRPGGARRGHRSSLIGPTLSALEPAPRIQWLRAAPVYYCGRPHVSRVPAPPRRHAPHPAHEATSATSDAPTSLLGRTLTCNERSPMPEAT